MSKPRQNDGRKRLGGATALAKKPSQTGKDTGLAKSKADLEMEQQEGLELAVAIAKEDKGLTATAPNMIKLAETHPEVVRQIVDQYNKSAVVFSSVAGVGSELTTSRAKTQLFYRQQIIHELQLDTAAEIQILDVAMDAYLHWQTLTSLVRTSFQKGSSQDLSKTQVRLASMAQSYFRTYMEAMTALKEAKASPIRVVQVQAGQNVAIQINEKTKTLEAHYAPELAHQGEGCERRMLSKSTPARSEEVQDPSD